MDLKLPPFYFLSFLFACRLARGYKEVSTSLARRRRGTPLEMSTASSLVAAMSAEQIRLYNQILTEISLEPLDNAATTTVGEADNVIYFTWEQFVVGLRLPVPSLVKQFLHFTRAPPELIHKNIFQILMGCSVLNSLYQLDISLEEIYFIYTLKLEIESLLSMSTHSP